MPLGPRVVQKLRRDAAALPGEMLSGGNPQVLWAVSKAPDPHRTLTTAAFEQYVRE